ITSRAPAVSGQSISQTAASDGKGLLCSTLSSALKGKASCIQCNRFSKAACSLITPLGFLGEPEVYSTQAGWTLATKAGCFGRADKSRAGQSESIANSN